MKIKTNARTNACDKIHWLVSLFSSHEFNHADCRFNSFYYDLIAVNINHTTLLWVGEWVCGCVQRARKMKFDVSVLRQTKWSSLDLSNKSTKCVPLCGRESQRYEKWMIEVGKKIGKKGAGVKSLMPIKLLFTLKRAVPHSDTLIHTHTHSHTQMHKSTYLFIFVRFALHRTLCVCVCVCRSSSSLALAFSPVQLDERRACHVKANLRWCWYNLVLSCRGSFSLTKLVCVWSVFYTALLQTAFLKSAAEKSKAIRDDDNGSDSDQIFIQTNGNFFSKQNQMHVICLSSIRWCKKNRMKYELMK